MLRRLNKQRHQERGLTVIKTESKIIILLFILASAVVLIAGCAPAFRAHPDLQARVREMKSVAALPPDVKIYEFSAGGVRDLRDDWCATGKANMEAAVGASFKDKPFEIKQVKVDKEIEEEIEDISALYRAVSGAIILHTYNENFRFPEKMKRFEYSLGPLGPILDHFGSDGLIFVYGEDEISTGGRKALQAFAVLAGAFTGVMIIPRGGTTAVSVALVDKTGDILWYNVKAREGSHDLRKAESCTDFIGQVLTDFPKLGQK
jgi:hypothetical protein